MKKETIIGIIIAIFIIAGVGYKFYDSKTVTIENTNTTLTTANTSANTVVNATTHYIKYKNNNTITVEPC